MKTSSFTIHRIQGYICFIFLIEYKEKLLLLDSGCINDVPVIEEYIRKNFSDDPSRIKLQVVTHNHPDHAGGSYRLREKYGIPIAAYKDIDLWYSGITGFLQHKIDCLLTLYSAKFLNKPFQNVYFKRKIKPDFDLKDGDELPGFQDWKVIAVPGHTLYDIVLYNEKNTLLYASDTVTNLNGKISRPIPVPFPELMEKSYLKLAELKVLKILPAHGDIIETGDSGKLFNTLSELAIKPLPGVPSYINLLTDLLPNLSRIKTKKS